MSVKLTSLTLREEHSLRVFENRVLRRMFGLKRDEVTGEWRKLHNEELHILYSSPKYNWEDQILINNYFSLKYYISGTFEIVGVLYSTTGASSMQFTYLKCN
jgi:hypothetical protein